MADKLNRLLLMLLISYFIIIITIIAQPIESNLKISNQLLKPKITDHQFKTSSVLISELKPELTFRAHHILDYFRPRHTSHLNPDDDDQNFIKASDHLNNNHQLSNSSSPQSSYKPLQSIKYPGTRFWS